MVSRILIALFLFSFAVSPAGAEGEWQYGPPMPNSRYGHDAILGKDGNIYVMGGLVCDYKIPYEYNSGRYSNISFDISHDKWIILEPVPGSANDDDIYYFYEKENDSWLGMREIEKKEDIYEIILPLSQEGNIINMNKEKLRNTDFSRQGDGVAIATGKEGLIYWTGGRGEWNQYGEKLVLEYDPVNNKWSEAQPFIDFETPLRSVTRTVYESRIPPMQYAHINHEALVTSDGTIYVIGGLWEEPGMDGKKRPRTFSHSMNAVERWKPGKKKWEFRSRMSSERFLFAAVVGPDDKIYAFGGARVLLDGTRPVLDATEVYDPGTDTWSLRSPMPEERCGHAAVLGADNRIYVMGGEGGRGQPERDLFIYDTVLDKWQRGPDMNSPRTTLAAVATPDGMIYAIGGTDIGAYKYKGLFNRFTPKGEALPKGKVQDTMEILDIKQLSK